MRNIEAILTQKGYRAEGRPHSEFKLPGIWGIIFPRNSVSAEKSRITGRCEALTPRKHWIREKLPI